MFARAAVSCFLAAAVATSASGCAHRPSQVRMAMLSGAAGFAGGTFSAQAASGLAACTARTGAVTSAVTASPPADYEGGLALLATENFTPVVAVGAEMTDAVAAVARRFPGTHFDLLDGVVDATNVTSVRFDDAAGARLAGALAALVSRTHRVAFLAGDPVPRIAPIASGFAAGARAMDPHVRVRIGYVGSFTDRAAGAATMRGILARGADVVYVVAGPAGIGAIEALRGRRDRYAIGVDADQDGLVPGTVIASVVKRFDVAADVVCTEAVSQKPTFGTLVLGLDSRAIGVTRSPYAHAVVTARIVARLAAYQTALEANAPAP